MAIAKKTVTSYYQGTATTVHTFAHTVSASDTQQVVVVSFFKQAGGTFSSITYDGVAMTLAGNDGSEIRQYYLVNPPSGTKNVVITFATGAEVYAVASTYAGVDTSNPFVQFISGNSGTFADLTVNTTGVTGAYAVSMGRSTTGAFNMVEDTVRYFKFIDAGAILNYRVADSNGIVPTNAVVRAAATSGGVFAVSTVLRPATIPQVTQSAVSNIATTAVDLAGEVVSDAGSVIIQRGFVYNTSTLPTLANSFKTVSGTTGTYSTSLSSLTPGTTYYIRAFATNALGTSYSNEISFTTLTSPQYDIQYDLGAEDDETYVGQITVTGTLGTVTVKLGTTGTSTAINAGAGASTFSGTYSGLSGLIITRSANFNGTIDNVYYAKVPLGTTIDWSLNTVAITTSIPSEVFFKRVEDQIFNNFRFYRYLDLLFKDLDGYVTVTVRQEREDNTTEKSKVFIVGNPASGTVSPFQKKRISFLCKDQAIIIGLSNDNLNETFSIAQYLLIGDKKPKRMISPSKVISVS